MVGAEAPRAGDADQDPGPAAAAPDAPASAAPAPAPASAIDPADGAAYPRQEAEPDCGCIEEQVSDPHAGWLEECATVLEN